MHWQAERKSPNTVFFILIYFILFIYLFFFFLLEGVRSRLSTPVNTSLYAPEGQTARKCYYQQDLCQLPDAVWHKRPDLWTAKNWQLHHDNAPAHSLHLIQIFLAKHGIPVVHQPPYSLDMAPCNFWLLPTLKGSSFESREEIMQNAMAEMTTIPKEAFQKCFRQWKDQWVKCVEAQGVYFEGD